MIGWPTLRDGRHPDDSWTTTDDTTTEDLKLPGEIGGAGWRRTEERGRVRGGGPSELGPEGASALPGRGAKGRRRGSLPPLAPGEGGGSPLPAGALKTWLEDL